MSRKHVFEWRDAKVRHVFTASRRRKGGTRLRMRIVKGENIQELPPIDLPQELEEIQIHWKGEAVPVTDPQQLGMLYVQGRVLIQLNDGCVYWAVNHWVGPGLQTRSIDSWCFMPGMCARSGTLAAI